MEQKKTVRMTGAGGRLSRWLVQYAGQIAFLVILFVILSVASPTFRTPGNLINVARHVSVNMIVN